MKYKKGTLYTEIKTNSEFRGLAIISAQEKAEWLIYWGNVNINEIQWKKVNEFKMSALLLTIAYFEEL